MNQKYDVIILGAGAAGLMCAIEAGKRSRRVLLLERADRIGRKILISGGGRCNFTNLHTTPDNFLSANPHFAKSALARYTPADFVRLVEKHRISYHEKKLGQLFCDRAASDITAMLEQECRNAGIEIRLSTKVNQVRKNRVRKNEGREEQRQEEGVEKKGVAGMPGKCRNLGRCRFYDTLGQMGIVGLPLFVVEPAEEGVALGGGGQQAAFPAELLIELGAGVGRQNIERGGADLVFLQEFEGLGKNSRRVVVETKDQRGVKVNADDKQVRENRLNLLASLRATPSRRSLSS